MSTVIVSAYTTPTLLQVSLTSNQLLYTKVSFSLHQSPQRYRDLVEHRRYESTLNPSPLTILSTCQYVKLHLQREYNFTQCASKVS